MIAEPTILAKSIGSILVPVSKYIPKKSPAIKELEASALAAFPNTSPQSIFIKFGNLALSFKYLPYSKKIVKD
jgi:hypothetical protein